MPRERGAWPWLVPKTHPLKALVPKWGAQAQRLTREPDPAEKHQDGETPPSLSLAF